MPDSKRDFSTTRHNYPCGRLLGLIAAALILPFSATARAQSAPATPPYPPPGKLVDMGGWRLHLNCTGVVGASRPTVILEAGVGDFSVEWSLVQPAVARFARVCSYDRAGSAWSDLGPRPRTMRQIVWELHTLLEKAGERGPYVLVGHSWGGMLAQVYTLMYPADVAGLVLVESGHENGIWTLVNGQPVLLAETATGRAIPPVKTSNPLRESDIPPGPRGQIEAAAKQMGPRANEQPRDKLPIEAQRMRTWALSQLKHYAANDNPFDGEELALLIAEKKKTEHVLGDMPLIVLSRARPEDRGPSGQRGEDEHKKNQATLVNLSRIGKQVIATRSGHHIQIEEPELVVTAIRNLLTATRK
ncbi:MAG: alpha/beta hydrolase [Blastocatellia bacterium]